jgi:hypothetical protein
LFYYAYDLTTPGYTGVIIGCNDVGQGLLTDLDSQILQNRYFLGLVFHIPAMHSSTPPRYGQLLPDTGDQRSVVIKNQFYDRFIIMDGTFGSYPVHLLNTLTILANLANI